MSKSLGNFFTLRDLIAKGFSGREIRYLLLKAHYRETFNFTMSGLEEARSALMRLDECLKKLQERAGQSTPGGSSKLAEQFAAPMDEDLNISAGWAVVFDWVREMNRQLAAETILPAQAAAELQAWGKIDAVLGLGSKVEESAPPELLKLLEERQEARKAKDFKRADALRDQLKAKGWQIEDTPKGARLKPL
jgi:cysteinyl-tRNA synthetase